MSDEEREQRIRVWFSPQELDIVDLVGMIREKQAEQGLEDNHPTQVSRGVCVKWYSLETDQEYADRLENARRHEAREEAWERKTYERLKEKYG